MTQKKEPLFSPLCKEEQKDHLDIDLDALYSRAFSELGLQQTNRDQIITLYLAMFSFLIPFALSMEGMSLSVKGLIFLATAIVGFLFALVIIRYRIYKEIYWLCCQSLTALQSVQPEKMSKEMIQKVYYHTLKKKGKSFLETDAAGETFFSNKLYVKKNLFSSESIYFFIHVFLTSLIAGLSAGLIVPLGTALRIAVAILVALAIFFILTAKYFHECIKVYGVLQDESDESFNHTFSKAWFLHFYV